jgi:hypothetical protein
MKGQKNSRGREWAPAFGSGKTKNYFLSFLGFFVSFFWFMPLAID